MDKVAHGRPEGNTPDRMPPVSHWYSSRCPSVPVRSSLSKPLRDGHGRLALPRTRYSDRNRTTATTAKHEALRVPQRQEEHSTVFRATVNWPWPTLWEHILAAWTAVGLIRARSDWKTAGSGPGPGGTGGTGRLAAVRISLMRRYRDSSKIQFASSHGNQRKQHHLNVKVKFPFMSVFAVPI